MTRIHDHDDEVEVDEVRASDDEHSAHELAAGPETAVAESLRSALASMREEAGRIASMRASDEQVAAAEQFAEGAGALDDEIGSAARADVDS